MKNEYNGGLTREQFLFYEIRTVASLHLQGYSKDEIVERIKAENLFQFPTERMIASIAAACFRRIEALESETLIEYLCRSSEDLPKAAHLLAFLLRQKERLQVPDLYAPVPARSAGTYPYGLCPRATGALPDAAANGGGCLADRRAI